MPSSTSSSNRLPLAFLAAQALVGLAEIGFRLIPRVDLLPYNLGEDEYTSARLAIEDHGPAPVSIIGSSRAREAIPAPLIEAAMSARTANYACGGATAIEVRSLANLLLRRQPKPRLIIYGLTPRQLWGHEVKLQQASLFWEMEDFRRNPRWDLFPNVVRTYLSRLSFLFRYRDRLRIGLERLAGDEPPLSNPMLGLPTTWHEAHPQLSMIGRQVTDERVAWYVNNLLRDGRYTMLEAKVDALAEIVTAIRKEGIRVVLVELPLAPILHRHLPRDVMPRFYHNVERVLSRTPAPWIRLDQLDLQLDNRHFLDQSHLNLEGARRFTRALMQHPDMQRIREAIRIESGTPGHPAG